METEHITSLLFWKLHHAIQTLAIITTTKLILVLQGQIRLTGKRMMPGSNWFKLLKMPSRQRKQTKHGRATHKHLKKGPPVHQTHAGPVGEQSQAKSLTATSSEPSSATSSPGDLSQVTTPLVVASCSVKWSKQFQSHKTAMGRKWI